jgi:hypothetical protein
VGSSCDGMMTCVPHLAMAIRSSVTSDNVPPCTQSRINALAQSFGMTTALVGLSYTQNMKVEVNLKPRFNMNGPKVKFSISNLTNVIFCEHYVYSWET